MNGSNIERQERLRQLAQVLAEAEVDYLSEKLSQEGIVWYLEGFQDVLSFKLHGETVALSQLVNGVPVLRVHPDVEDNMVALKDFHKDALRLAELIL